jgi:hypothetical protein
MLARERAGAVQPGLRTHSLMCSKRSHVHPRTTHTGAGHRRRRATVAAASEEGIGAQIGRLAKKIQGALPIVGLLSRLASPEGGFDEVVSG